MLQADRPSDTSVESKEYFFLICYQSPEHKCLQQNVTQICRGQSSENHFHEFQTTVTVPYFSILLY
jgi:hypothetical protein